MKLDFSFVTKYLPSPKRATAMRAFVSPPREWFIGLALATCVFLVGCAYAGLFFLEVGKGVLEKGEDVTGVPSVSYEHEEVKAVLDLYTKRSAEFEALKAKAPASRVAPAETERRGGSAPLAE